MAEQRTKNKLSLALFKSSLQREEFETYIKQIKKHNDRNKKHTLHNRYNS
jgi:hypothetical protein